MLVLIFQFRSKLLNFLSSAKIINKLQYACNFFQNFCILRTRIFPRSKSLKSQEYENDSFKSQPILLSIHDSQNVQYTDKYQFCTVRWWFVIYRPEL